MKAGWKTGENRGQGRENRVVGAKESEKKVEKEYGGAQVWLV